MKFTRVVVEAEVREHRRVGEARFDVRPIDKELIGRRDRWRGAFIPRRARGAAIAGLKGARHIDGWAGPCGPGKLGPRPAASTRFQFRPLDEHVRVVFRAQLCPLFLADHRFCGRGTRPVRHERLVAAPHLFEQLRRRDLDFVALRHDRVRGFRAREIVEQRGGTIVGEHVAQRHDGNPIDRRDRSLGRRIVGADRLDRVADEFEPDRMRFRHREDVDDAAAGRELAVLIGGIFAAEAGVDEQFRQIGRRDILTGFQLERGGEESLWRGHARQQAGGRRDDYSRGAAADAVQRAGPRGGDADVRREAAIRIDLVRRKRQHRPLGRHRRQPFERGEKERDVGDRLLEVAVARHDVEHHPMRPRLRRRGHEQRVRGLGETRHDARRDIHSAAHDGGLQNGAKVEGRRRGHEPPV
ncbi:MAG: hypothetical protein DMF99_15570 [Acidobacteria bacterium]|nr:MAG: hypothetical protein DMF99_15570 [Acidobacteriota bacterium]